MCAIRNVLGRPESSLAFDTSNVTWWYFPDFNYLLSLRDKSKYSKHISIDNYLGIFLPSWTSQSEYFSDMHNTPPTIFLPTIQSTQHKRKQSTAKDQLRQRIRGSHHDADSWRIIMTDCSCLFAFLKRHYFPVTVSQKIPKAGKVGQTQKKLIWRTVSMLSVTTDLLLLSFCPIFGKRDFVLG